MAQRNDGSESSSEGSEAGFAGFGGIGINFGPDGASIVEGLPGSQPSPQLMMMAKFLLPMLQTRATENMNNAKGKGAKGKGYSDAAVPPSGVNQNVLVHANLFGDETVSNEGGGASSSRDPVAEEPGDAEMNDESQQPKEGKGSKKKKSTKGKGKRAGKQRKY